MKHFILFCLLILQGLLAFTQKDVKPGNYLGSLIPLDSAGHFIITVKSSENGVSSNAKFLWPGSEFVNVLFYDANTDKYTTLSDSSLFITHIYTEAVSIKKKLPGHIYYLIKSVDFNKDGKLDHNDPDILWVSDNSGQVLKPLSAEDANMESIVFYPKEGFAICKFQYDADGDLDFETSDRKFIYRKLDLAQLTFGADIKIP